jgi:hypothetical protein
LCLREWRLLPPGVLRRHGRLCSSAVKCMFMRGMKNPAGFIISGGMDVYGEASGSNGIEGRAKATAKEIADVLKKRFQDQGWIN